MAQKPPKIYVTRRLPEEALAPLRTCGDLHVWESDTPVPRETLLQEITNTNALLGMVSERIDGRAARPRSAAQDRGKHGRRL